MQAELTHRCTQTAVNLKNSELVQVFRVELGGKLVIRDDLVRGQRFDEVPVAERGESARSLRTPLTTHSGLFLDFSTKYRVKR